MHSQAQPTIKWFRKLTTNSDDDDADGGGSSNDEADDDNFAAASGRRVRLLGGVYRSLESAGERALGDAVYLSKLQLPATELRPDAATTTTYVCVAINYRGYAMRETQLSVVDDDDDVDYHGRDYDEAWTVSTSSQSRPLSLVSGDADDEPTADDDGGRQTQQLMLLFLIPLGLAAMPLLLWGCYLMCRSGEAAAAARQRQRHDDKELQAAARVRRYSLVCQNEIYV